MNTVIILICCAAVICQLVVSVLAVHLSRISGVKYSWGLLAVVSAFMAARPLVVIVDWLSGKAQTLPDFQSGLTWLAVAVLLLTGVSSVAASIFSFKESREKQVAREQRLAAMIDNAADLFLVCDAEGQIIDANLNADSILGYSRNELLLLSLAEIEKGQDHWQIRALCNRMIPEASLGVEGVCQRKDGSTFPVEIDLVLHEVSGEKLYLAVLHDCTERQQARESLKRSESRYKSLVAAVSDYIYAVEVRAGRAVKTIHGPGCIAVTGYTPEDFETDPLLWYRMVVEDDRDRVVAQSARVVTGEIVPLEHRIIHKDGSVRWVRNAAVPRYDEQGMLIAYDGLVTDISARKRIEDDLRLKSAAIEASAQAVMITDRDGRIVWVNPAFTTLTGYLFDEVINLDPRFLTSGQQRKLFYRTLWRTIMAGDVWHGELINQRKNGSRYYEEQTITPVKDDRGEIRYFVAIKQDISERKKVEKALLENATICRDMKIARQIQRSLLPTHPPVIAGVQLAGHCVPAAHVVGDYYDYFIQKEGVLGLVIADVAGHSVGSALLMAMARSVIHATITPHASPGEIMVSVNDLLHDDLGRAELLISMFYLKLNMITRVLTYANAGHIQPLLLRRADSSLIALDADGLVLGVQRDVLFEEKTCRIESGDVFALYTDGIPEAENETGEFFGRIRLEEVIRERCEDTPDTIAMAVINSLTAFVGTRPLEDDTTLVIIKID